MALEYFKTEYRLDKTVTNIVICIYRKSMKDADNSHINRTLAQFFKELDRKKGKVAVAYTFGDGIVDARDFTEPKDHIIYASECKKKSAPLSHIWLMGMALLEEKEREDRENGLTSKNVLCLLTDESFGRVDTEKILVGMENRFHNVEVKLVLVTDQPSSKNEGRLEEYIRNNGDVYTV